MAWLSLWVIGRITELSFCPSAPPPGPRCRSPEQRLLQLSQTSSTFRPRQVCATVSLTALGGRLALHQQAVAPAWSLPSSVRAGAEGYHQRHSHIELTTHSQALKQTDIPPIRCMATNAMIHLSIRHRQLQQAQGRPTWGSSYRIFLLCCPSLDLASATIPLESQLGQVLRQM